MIIRLIILLVSVFLAWGLDRVVELSPIRTAGSNHGFVMSELLGFSLGLLICGFVLAAVIRLWRERLGRGWKNLLREACFASTSWTGMAIVTFFTGLVPIDPNFIIIGTAIAVFLMAGNSWLRGKSEEGKASGALERTAPFVLFVLLAATIPAFLGGVMVYYSNNPAFKRKINLLQNSFVFKKSTYILTEMLPEVRFLQPIDFGYDAVGDRLFVLERGGRVFEVGPDRSKKELLVDLSSLVGDKIWGEVGAYSLLLHKQFAEGKESFYVFLTVRGEGFEPSNQLLQIDLGLSGPKERFEKRREVLTIPTSSGTHNSGALVYDPTGFLLVAIGEMGKGQLCQDLDGYLNGKVLRIDPDQLGGEQSFPARGKVEDGIERDYFVPFGNPFEKQEGALPEIWAYGLRNPFRAYWDPRKPGLMVGDIGPWTWEELNLVTAGKNYGWPARENRDSYEKNQGTKVSAEENEPPIYAYRHTARNRSIVAGGVVWSSEFPDLKGQTLWGDNFSGEIWALDEKKGDAQLLARAPDFNQSGMTRIEPHPKLGVVVVVMGSMTEETGTLYRLVPDDGTTPALTTSKEPRPAKELFATHCALCHGPGGKGDGSLASQPGITIADFTSGVWQESVSEEVISKVIARGGAAVQKSAVMPPWRGVLSDEEIESMVAYLRSLKGEGGEPVDKNSN